MRHRWRIEIFLFNKSLNECVSDSEEYFKEKLKDFCLKVK